MRRNSAGFSLVEVVIAMSILAIALFGMISVITYSSRNNAVAKERVMATRAAEKQIETMRAMASTGTLSAVYSAYKSSMAAATFAVYQDNDPSNPTAAPALLPSPAGQISFPVDSNSPPWLREDLTGAFLGRYDSAGNPLNIDMDQSGAVDATDKSASTTLAALPVKVTVTWKGLAGNGQVILTYVLTK
jgi:type IV pilus modification protein PilV